MRLIDSIRAKGIGSVHGEMPGAMDLSTYLRDVIEESPVYVVDNVFDYIMEHFSDYKDFHCFPNVAPPHRSFWMEYRRVLDNPRIPFEYNGICVVADERKDGKDGWCLHCFLVSRPAILQQPLGPTIQWHLDVDPDGTIVGLWPFTDCAEEGSIEEQQYLESAEKSLGFIGVLCLALSFLHCKNVIVTNQEGMYPSRQARREAQRRNDPPLVTYKTLQIEPMKKVLATEGGVAHNGLKKALHICRGHFAEYGDEYGKGKLFGKYEGRFWMPAHVRGSADAGVALKDYNVKAPRKDAA